MLNHLFTQATQCLVGQLEVESAFEEGEALHKASMVLLMIDLDNLIHEDKGHTNSVFVEETVAVNDVVGVWLALGQPKPDMFEEVVRIVGPISSEDGPIVGG